MMNGLDEIVYLIGCYLITADKEINTKEIEALDFYLQGDKNKCLIRKQHEFFSDAEEKTSLANLLLSLSGYNCSSEKRKDILRFFVRMSFVDGYISPEERDLINKISDILKISPEAYITEAAQEYEERAKATRLKRHQRIIGKLEKVYYDHIANKGNTKTIDSLFGSWNFANVIEKITAEAEIDLERVSNILDDLNKKFSNTQESIHLQIKTASNEKNKYIRECQNIVEGIALHLDNAIMTAISHNIDVIEKKKKNIEYFTIAFMGRTKAGKSTFHKVITQQADDDVGIGKTRTTRYNRSWYWDKLRIVDTPGIGAPGGEVDTEIAKSIIDEADVICYVVTSDAIQETEFDFFETIKERNKPLYIILNVKSNLTSEIRLRRFLQDPSQWRTGNGRESIQGHFDRIHDRLEGKYNMDAVKIIPIHLLAAQLGMENRDNADQLLEGSNIKEWVREIKSDVYNTGTLKKSLSVMDGASYQIHSISNILNGDYQVLTDKVSMLKKTQKDFRQFINKESKKLKSDIKKLFEDTKSSLCNYASDFADSHYDDKEAGEHFGKDSQVIRIQDEMRERLQIRLEDFSAKSKAKIEELSEDLNIECNINNNVVATGERIKDTKLRIGLFGTLLGSATPFIVPLFISNPAGWVLMAAPLVVFTVVSIIAGMFTSKSEKIRKAQEKMRNSLTEGISSNMRKNQKKMLSEIFTSINKTSASVENLFTTYIKGVESLLEEMAPVINQCKNDESAINSLIGFRVLDYLKKGVISVKKVSDLSNDELYSQYPVKRDWTQQSLTFEYETKCNDADKIKAEEATQMKIIFNIK